MTTTNLTRRTAVLGTVTLPAALAPLGLAQAATANATDAAWAEYEAARDAFHATRATGGDSEEPVERYCDADKALQDAPAATLVDVERKIAVTVDFEGYMDETQLAELLPVIRAAIGRVA